MMHDLHAYCNEDQSVDIEENNNNNMGHLYGAVPIIIYSTAHYIITNILLFGAHKHYEE